MAFYEVYVKLCISNLPEDDACNGDIGGKNIGDVSDRDEYDAVMLPLNQVIIIYLVAVRQTMSYVLSLVHGKVIII